MQIPARLSIRLAALLAAIGSAGCATSHGTSDPLSATPVHRWREVHGAISPEIHQLLHGSGITILSVWYDDPELMAVLDVAATHPLEEGFTVLVGRGSSVLARINIVQVDGRSAIGVVILHGPPQQFSPLQLTSLPPGLWISRPGAPPVAS